MPIQGRPEMVAARAKACGVHHEPQLEIGGLVEELLDGARRGEVGRQHPAARAVSAGQGLGQDLQPGLATGHEHEVQTGSGQLGADRPADAGRGARDQRPGAVGRRDGGHFSTTVMRVVPSDTATAASSKVGARMAGRALLEVPQASLGMPTRLVSSAPLPLASTSPAKA